MHPTRLAFEGLAMLALIAAAGAAIYTWSHRPASPALIVGFVMFWLLGAVVTVLLHSAFDRSR
jgi:membrane protein YdbS with pleckstrin-like domain